MFPFPAVLIGAAVACILFGLWLALNIGGSAERRAEHHRDFPPAPPRFPWRNEHYSYRPTSTAGMRRSGALFVFVGLFFLLISFLLGSLSPL